MLDNHIEATVLTNRYITLLNSVLNMHKTTYTNQDHVGPHTISDTMYYQMEYTPT